MLERQEQLDAEIAQTESRLTAKYDELTQLTAAQAARSIRTTKMAQPCAACAMDGACGRGVTTVCVERVVLARCAQAAVAEWRASRAHSRVAQQRWPARSVQTQRGRGRGAHAHDVDSALS